MARVTGQRWVVNGKVLRVYDDSCCPICGHFDKVSSSAEYQQASFLPDVPTRHWDVCECSRCSSMFVSYIEFETTPAGETADGETQGK
jgi:hypothetical protein